MAPGGLVPPEPKFGSERTGDGYWKKREVKTKRPLLAQITKESGSSSGIDLF
jgi:hypothetical protein